MRPGQNKRMRGRNNNNNNRKGPNPLTRSYESNGPDVKIRGTAHHIGEKYLQLARDAQSSGDPVMAESYLQHAEHYFRLIAAAQQAQQQAQFGYQRQPGEQIEQDEDDADDDFASLPDRFASPPERIAPPPPPQPFPAGQPYGDRQAQSGERYDRNNGQSYQYGDRQGGQNGDRQNFDRPDRNQERNQDRNYDNRGNRTVYQAQDRNGQDRNGQDRQGQAQDRQAQDRQGQDRQGQDRQGQDRQNQDRQGSDRNGYDRNPQYRADADRNGQDRSGQDRSGQDRPPRDYDNRGFRGRNRDDRQPREFRDNNQSRDLRPPVPEEQPVGLPAFITSPVRTPQEAPADEQPSMIEAVPATTPETGDEAGFHMRPRRRRRPKSEFAGVEGGEGNQDAPASDPVD